MRAYVAKSSQSGSWTLDNFGIYPFEGKQILPQRDESVDYFYNESFTATTPGAILGDDGESDPFGYVEAGNINTGTGNNASSFAKNMFINENDKLQIESTSEKPHCWYFGTEAKERMKAYEGNLAISMKVQADETMCIYLGSGANASTKIYTFFNSTLSRIGNGRYGSVEESKIPYQQISGKTFINTGEMSEILFLIDKETDSYSVWLDGARLVTAVPMNNTIADYSGINCINFRLESVSGGQKVIVDDIQVYPVKEDDLIKTEKVLGRIQKYSDICMVDDKDSKPTDLKDVSEILGESACSLVIEDSGGYLIDNHIVFPLTDDETDITISVTSGDLTVGKLIKNVPMPAAYSFGEIDWGVEVPHAGSQFDCAVLPATVRNEASDNGRLSVAAALYDNTGENPVIEAVGAQADTLVENGITAKGFPIILNLEEVDEIPETSVVKVFLWDEHGNMFGEEYSKEYTKD